MDYGAGGEDEDKQVNFEIYFRDVMDSEFWRWYRQRRNQGSFIAF